MNSLAIQRGGIAATALVFSAIVAAYLMLDGDVKTLGGDIKAVQVEQARAGAKLDSMDRTVSGIDGKMDKLLEERRSKPVR